MQAVADIYRMKDAAAGLREKVEFVKGRAVHPANYSGKFYLRVSENGKRVWKKFDTVTDALLARDQWTANRSREKAGMPTVKPDVSKLLAPSLAKGSIAAAAQEFITYSDSRVADWRNGADNGLSPNSFVAYRKAIQSFATSCAEFGAKDMSEFSGERGVAILLHFKKWLSKNVTRRSGKAAHGDARKFIIVDSFLARNGIKMKKDRKFNPNDPGLLPYADVTRVKKGRIGDVVFYTPNDLRAMLEAADTCDKDKSLYSPVELKELLLTFLLTGCRDEEIQHLTWKCVNGRISIEDQPKYDWRVKDHEKRMVTVPPELKTWLESRRKRNIPGEDLVFPNGVGNPQQNFADAISGMQKRATAARYKFSRPECLTHILHNFRKSYATYQMIVYGQSPRDIQRDLGHSELSTTERYLASVGDAKEREAIVKGYQKLLKDYARPRKDT